MEVNRRAMLEALQIIHPAVATRELIEQQTHSIFANNYVSAFNGQIYISYPFPMEQSFSTKFTDLNTVLSSIKDDHITITIHDDKVIVTASDTEAELNAVADDRELVTNMLDELRQEQTDWKLLPENFAEALWLTAFSASKNMREGVIVGVLVNKKDVLSTDTRRASWYELDAAIDDKFLIASTDAVELGQFNLAEYTVGKNWVHFRTEKGVLFSSRILKGKALPIKQLFTSLTEIVPPIDLPDDFRTNVSAVNKFMEGTASDPGKTMDVLIKNGSIECSVKRERGKMKKTTKLTLGDTVPPSVMFQINPHFMLQVLDKSTTVSFQNLTKKPSNKDLPVETVPVATFLSGAFRHLVLLPIVRA